MEGLVAVVALLLAARACVEVPSAETGRFLLAGLSLMVCVPLSLVLTVFWAVASPRLAGFLPTTSQLRLPSSITKKPFYAISSFCFLNLLEIKSLLGVKAALDLPLDIQLVHLVVHGLVFELGPHDSDALGCLNQGELRFLDETLYRCLVEEHVGALGAFRLCSLAIHAQVDRLLLSDCLRSTINACKTKIRCCYSVLFNCLAYLDG